MLTPSHILVMLFFFLISIHISWIIQGYQLNKRFDAAEEINTFFAVHAIIGMMIMFISILDCGC
jgi:hypothetical protein